MPARTPEDIYRLFKEYLAQGYGEGLLSLYDPDVVFLNRSGVQRKGKHELRHEIEPLAETRSLVNYEIVQVIVAETVALMHTRWTWPAHPNSPQYAIEVAKQQSDGSWCWLIGDPFLIGKQISRGTHA
ncbi:MAG: nuclear transport factor 2 family protein [Bryobacterales bacterium]|nr:nuclear transport factor 2 family protein [Bryobacterales bacterium]